MTLFLSEFAYLCSYKMMYLCRQIVKTNIHLVNTKINNKIMINRKLTFGGMLMAALALGMPMDAHAAKKAAKQNFAGYLFAYFEGSGNKQEHLRFAISEDAKTGMRSTITSLSSPAILSVPVAVSATLISFVVKMAAIISWLPI